MGRHIPNKVEHGAQLGIRKRFLTDLTPLTLETLTMLPFVLVPMLLNFLSSSLTPRTGNTKGGSIAVPLTSCLNGLESI
jgi:hypothetical protein